MESVRKKLREVGYFLHKLTDRAAQAFGDPDELDFLLSGFLSAGRSVDYRLRHIGEDTYRTFRANWDTLLQPDEGDLIKFMIDDRNKEIHEVGSASERKREAIPVHGTYRDASGEVTMAGPPGESLTFHKPVLVFHIDGQSVPVTKSSAEYSRLLQRLVADYRSHIGSS